MLRKRKNIEELIEATEFPQSEPAASITRERRDEEVAAPVADRRRGGDRRGMDQLRAEALQSLMARVEDRNFGGLRADPQWNRRLKPSRLILLVVALVAGGIAAFLATEANQGIAQAVAQPAVIETVAEPRVQILVATQAIAVGQKLTSGALAWEEWPETAVRPEFITMAAAPDAATGMEGAVARVAIFAGEPMRAEKLLSGAQGSYLAAVLEPGTRAVSVLVAADSASGGFVAPNDRVDVVLTRSSETGHVSETILTDVRVLAVDSRMGEGGAPPEGQDAPQTFIGQAIATLELDATSAEVVNSAVTMGRLSLSLRPAGDVAGGDARQRATNQLIRMTSRFWKQ